MTKRTVRAVLGFLNPIGVKTVFVIAAFDEEVGVFIVFADVCVFAVY